jgi:hypothetical protein
MAEEFAFLRVEGIAALGIEGRYPERIVPIEPIREGKKGPTAAPIPYRQDLDANE